MISHKQSPRIVIIGMGPCGLGAAWRLQELGFNNYKIFDQSFHAGGLASSYIDENGFIWDVGSHVEFSHYSYFDDVLQQLIPPNEWVQHERSTWIWMKERFIPYPFQNNLRYLPETDLRRCIDGLKAVQQNFRDSKNFLDWIHNTFGEGIADLFMIPYNRKVWAFPPEELCFEWIDERVATPDLAKILQNILLEKDDISWGPNYKFLFPLKGSTGEIWKRLHAKLDPSKSFFGYQLTHVALSDHFITFENGTGESYDVLISTMPLDRFLSVSDFQDGPVIAQVFKHSSTHIVGIGIKGNVPIHLKGKSWIYFPEDEFPFYRVTVFSNYSPFNVPDSTRYWSLMTEIAESPVRPVNASTIFETVIEGMMRCSLISLSDQIVSTWYHYEPYGYPTPFLLRNGCVVM